MVTNWWSRTPKLLVFAGLTALAFSIFAARPNSVATNLAAASQDFYPGPCSKAPTNVNITFRGGTSGCTESNGKSCQPGEVIEFTASSPSYTFQVCDTFSWTFGDGTTMTTLWPTVTRQFTGNTAARTVRLNVSNSFNTAGVGSATLDVPPSNVTSCSPSSSQLCFVNNRYLVTLDASDTTRSGKTGTGEANTQTASTGYFTITALTSGSTDPQVVAKVVEIAPGTPWVFFGGLTDLEYFVNVLDTQTGNLRQYHKFPETTQNGFDTSGAVPSQQFPPPEKTRGQICPVPPVGATSTEAASTCTPGTNQLCLLGNRFRVKITATNTNPGPTQGQQAPGVAIPKIDAFGYFSLPGLTQDPTNLEFFIKVLDATSFSGKFWIFYGTLTNFQLSIEVTDTKTGQKRTYSRAGGTGADAACGGADTAAFPF